jgi:two-component system, OmpR family, sensor histidine kinase VicK
MKSKKSAHQTLLVLFIILLVIGIALGSFILIFEGWYNKEHVKMVAWGSAAVLGLLAISGIVVVTAVTRQVGSIKNEAINFANGDLSRKITVSDNSDIGQLAAAFNQMSDRLRTSYARIALEKQRDEILLESIGEGMIALDKDGSITLINNNARSMLNLGDGSVIGMAADKAFILSDDRGKPLSHTKRPDFQTLHTKQPQDTVVSFHYADKKPIMLHVNANPVTIDEAVAGAIIILRDVTREREVDRMKTEFISLASHQLRTPLSAIKWFTEMLLAGDAGKLKKEQQQFAQNIYDSSQRMIELVSSLLNISRIESGRIIIEPQPTDLSELINGIVNDLKAKTAEKEQSLIISVHKELPKISIDPQLIGQVYLNLLTNAIKYTPQGGEITVFVSRKDDQVVSQVTDNGYGIPKHQHERVFQKFFRAENAVKVETDGTGLGLYLIKAIIESSGGKIWFESAEGKGTTFWFSLPMSGMKAKAGEVTLDR